MARRRSRRRRQSNRGLAGLLIAGLLVLLVASIVDALARTSRVALTLMALVLGLASAATLYGWLRYRARKRLRVQSLGQLFLLTPAQFEQAIADLLHDSGYQDVHVVGQAGDLAADITCRDGKGRSVVVQCKRYAPGIRVGSPDIQTFIGMAHIHHGADYGIFVTTSAFSGPAVALAREHDIRLIDGEELSRLIAAAQLATGADPANPSCSRCGTPLLGERCQQCGWQSKRQVPLAVPALAGGVGVFAVLLLLIQALPRTGTVLSAAPPVTPALNQEGLALASPVAVEPTPAPTTLETYVVTGTGAAGLIVRSAPQQANNQIGSLYDSDQVVVTGVPQAGWYAVRGSDFSGFVMSQYLTGPHSAPAGAVAHLVPMPGNAPAAKPAAAGAAASPSTASTQQVLALGYQPTSYRDTPNFPLQVLLGVRTGSADGYNQQAFFFYNGKYLGTDLSSSSAGIALAWRDADTVALSYRLYRPGEPMCCPTGGAAIVRYRWNGTALQPLDPLPAEDANAPLSRR